MQATRIAYDLSSLSTAYVLTGCSSLSSENLDLEVTIAKAHAHEAPPAASDAEAEQPRSESIDDLDEEVKKTGTDNARDPIRQFGIFVPGALRAAQNDFVSAVEKPIPKIVNLQRRLRELEIEIGRARKNLKKFTDT